MKSTPGSKRKSTDLPQLSPPHSLTSNPISTNLHKRKRAAMMLYSTDAPHPLYTGRPDRNMLYADGAFKQVSDTEWLLALRRPEPGAQKKPSKVVALAEQLVLPEFGKAG